MMSACVSTGSLMAVPLTCRTTVALLNWLVFSRYIIISHKSLCISCTFFSEFKWKKSRVWPIFGNIWSWSSACVIPRLFFIFQSLATKREHPKFFYSWLKRKSYGNWNFTIGLNDTKTCNNHRAGVVKPYLVVLSCLLIALHWKLNLSVCIHPFSWDMIELTDWVKL